MISGKLFWMEARRSLPTFLVALALLSLGSLGAIYLFDPSRSGLLTSFSAALPELWAMLGMDGPTSTLTRFVATYLYGCAMILLPLIYIVPTAGRLMVQHVSDGSLIYLLAAPVGRRRITNTQMMVLLAGTGGLMLLSGAITWLFCLLLFPRELDLAWYGILHLACFCVQLAIAGFCFFVSCYANHKGRYYAVSLEILALFYLLSMLSRLGGPLAWFRYLTPFSLFDPVRIVMGEETWPLILPLLLAAVGILLFHMGAAHFRKRNLSI